MKVNVVIDSTSRAAGGLFDAERRLCQCLNEAGVTISAFSLADDFSAQDAGEWLPIVPESFPVGWPGALGRSSRLRARLLAEPADLLYRAGLWKWPSRYAIEWSRSHKKPEIIAPHGMLDAWAVNNSAWKKRPALLLYEREHLGRAACLRALCEAEARAIRAFGLTNPICIIPNGVDLPIIPNAEKLKTEMLKSEASSKEQGAERKTPGANPFAASRKTLLYLGRIHPKKGLVNLLKAWAAIQKAEGRGQRAEWVLAIAGWDQGGHERELKQLATGLGLKWMDVREKAETLKTEKLKGTGFNVSILACQYVSVLFLGPKFGEEKEALYRNCDAFILPSFSEGLPMVVLEAWAYGKPVLMTPECNLPEGFAANAAIRIEPNVESIACGLDQLVRSPSSDLCSLGASGRALVASRFAWPKIAADMKFVYEWVLGGGPRPGCVQTKC